MELGKFSASSIGVVLQWWGFAFPNLLLKPTSLEKNNPCLILLGCFEVNFEVPLQPCWPMFSFSRKSTAVKEGESSAVGNSKFHQAKQTKNQTIPYKTPKTNEQTNEKTFQLLKTDFFPVTTRPLVTST